ncbi:hypothetical protein C4D60_Mb08t33360 [Musa balbisiana]|uniref:Uncharacterized protein n=1 Tax=Musa balbisiana TaxID=52838 RepID=A0A4S8K8F2_MUSBA|nr:hypothetical protein C4D60_Mb08t33360 [Musa balbisiana]
MREDEERRRHGRRGGNKDEKEETNEEEGEEESTTNGHLPRHLSEVRLSPSASCVDQVTCFNDVPPRRSLEPKHRALRASA